MNAAEILDAIQSLRVLVAGDICLDRWCWYDPALSEASAETSIPRTAVVRTEVTPGAGGTVASNLASLGVDNVSVLGVAGQDGSARELRRALDARHISTDLLISEPGLCTFTYTKLLNCVTDEEDKPRVDFVNTESLPPEAEAALIDALRSHWSSFDVFIVSDQAETGDGGVVTPAVRKCLIELARTDSGKVVWVDSRRRSELFEGVILKPNREEAEAACQRRFGSVDFRRLAIECKARLLIVTHGDRGALVLGEGIDEWVGTRKVKPVDVCGAGDSFSAGAACALAVTGSPMDAARFGNAVASITVTKKGTGTASPAEILAAAAEFG